jgi:ADP-ribosylglycohydrolase
MERCLVSLEGLSVGDAFGERFFGPEEDVARRLAERALPPFPWHWTDDTAMALSIVDELDARGAIDHTSLADRFARRYAREPHRGYGHGARQILDSLKWGRPWRQAAVEPFGEIGSYGNGGAMRVAPLGAYFADDLDAVVDQARRSAEVTHLHPEGIAGAIATAVAAAYASRPDGDGLLATVEERTPSGETRLGLRKAIEMGPGASIEHAAAVLGVGWRVSAMDTVPFALWCAARHLTDFEAAMWTTVSGLGDRDTTCAIVGGIVALRTGVDAIPAAWRQSREPLPGRAGGSGRGPHSSVPV